jgi:hypothetical protein
MIMRNRLQILRLAVAGLLGIAAPLLLSCGSSGAGLIPVGNAGPLQGDFETVAQAAENGNGSCTTTEEAILKTERDFSMLPATVDQGLRNRMHEGIVKLRSEALGLCKQPLAQATATNTSSRITTNTQTTSTTPTTPTTTTPTTPTTTPTTSGPAGGTPAPGTGAGEAAPGTGSEQGGAGEGSGRAGGDGSGGAGAGGGLEGGK